MKMKKTKKLLKSDQLEKMERSDLSAYLAGLELEKIETTKKLNEATSSHNKIVKAINEVKAELMQRNSKYKQTTINF